MLNEMVDMSIYPHQHIKGQVYNGIPFHSNITDPKSILQTYFVSMTYLSSIKPHFTDIHLLDFTNPYLPRKIPFTDSLLLPQISTQGLLPTPIHAPSYLSLYHALYQH